VKKKKGLSKQLPDYVTREQSISCTSSIKNLAPLCPRSPQAPARSGQTARPGGLQPFEGDGGSQLWRESGTAQAQGKLSHLPLSHLHGLKGSADLTHAWSQKDPDSRSVSMGKMAMISRKGFSFENLSFCFCGFAPDKGVMLT